MTWAEEFGIGHVATATASGSREANRFMARLALGPSGRAPDGADPGRPLASWLGPLPGRAAQVTQVLAVRRSLRHARSGSASA